MFPIAHDLYVPNSQVKMGIAIPLTEMICLLW